MIISAHCAEFSSGVLTNLDRSGADAEYIFIAIHRHGYVFAYPPAKNGCELSPLIILSAGNHVGKTCYFLGMESLEKVMRVILLRNRVTSAIFPESTDYRR